jgi:hypothetical protein
MSEYLGINSKGMNPKTVAQLEKAMAGAIVANEDTHRALAAEIQRRGSRLGGDVGQNFGLNTGLHGNGFHNGLFGDGRYGHGQFGFGFGNGLGFGNFGMPGQGIGIRGQGSLSSFSGNTRAAHYKMGMCVQAYKGFGVAKNVIDLMANFASEGLKIKHPRKNIEKFYNRWAEHVNLQSRVKNILRYYYKYGNCFIYTTYGKIDDQSYDKMRRSKAKNLNLNNYIKVGGDTTDPTSKDKIKKTQKELNKPISEREIPWRYTLMNPFQMDLRGSKFFGMSRWVFVLDQETFNLIRSGGLKKYSSVDFLDETDVNLPPEFAQLAGKDEKDKDSRVVPLDPAKLWTLHYMKDDHEDWADPIIWPVMHDIFYKNKMRQMDLSVCNSIINAVTIFKLGDFKNGFIPPEKHFRKFAEFLRTPTSAMNLVWNDAVSIESNYPPVDRILGFQKYESVDRDILRGLGVPDTLLGGASSSNFSSGFLGVRTLLERLEEGRGEVIRWIKRQLRLIAATFGHRDIPSIKFGKMSLRDEKAEKQLILGLLDRNVISVESVLDTFGEDFAIELERLRDEQRIRDDEGLLQKHGPFTDPMATMNDEEVMDREEEQMDKEADRRMKEKKAEFKVKQRIQKQTQTQRPNGRPPNSGKKQQVKRETKPKGMAFISEYETEKRKALACINKVDELITKEILQAKSKKYKKSLSKKDRQGIEDISFAIASHYNLDVEVTFSNIQDVLRARNSVKHAVHNLYNEIISPGLSLDNRKLIMATAIAMYNMEVENAEG